MAHLILVAPPRSGASLLAACLRADPRWGSTALSQPDAPDTLHAVDWTPRLSMRVRELAEALPEATFVVVARRPVPTIASMMRAWSSQRFVSAPDLPDWWGDRWSFPLIPGWRDLIGAPLSDICTRQWVSIAESVMSDLAALPAHRWVVASFDALLEDPETEVRALVERVGAQWDAVLPDPLPVTLTAVTPPSDDSWQALAPDIVVALEQQRDAVDLFAAFVSSARPDLQWSDAPIDKGTQPEAQVVSSSGTPFQSSATDSMARLLEAAASSILVSTYKSGHVIVARSQGHNLNTEFTQLPRPMGIAASGSRLAIGVDDAITSFSMVPGIAPAVPSAVPTDAPYAHRATVRTGDIAIHDMAYDGDGELVFVNTRFSCLCRQDVNHSFVPIWRPEWITHLIDEDRCHLNGLAMVDGRPKYVTALAQTDTAHGWRELRGTGGVIVDVDTNEVVAQGLAMPHSPRWHDGRLWVLESGKGTLNTVDVAAGRIDVVATLPGFTRGLSFLGPFALVGLSQVRESVFQSLPITQTKDERNCGVWVVDIRTGQIAGWMKFEGMVQEIFEVAVLPHRWPVIVEDAALSRDAFVLRDETLQEVLAARAGSGSD